MKILNLYAGIGGNRKLWPDGHEITAVELNPKIAKIYKDFFPNDKVIEGDAHEYLLNNFKEYDFIWSSPPCQSHSKMVKFTKHNINKYPDMKLYQEILLLQEFGGKNLKYCIENVKPYYEPLISAQESNRHLFWANFYVSSFSMLGPGKFMDAGTVKDSEKLKKWLGLNYKGNIYYDGNHDPNQVLRNCVHPKLGKHVFNCAFKDIQLSLLN